MPRCHTSWHCILKWAQRKGWKEIPGECSSTQLLSAGLAVAAQVSSNDFSVNCCLVWDTQLEEMQNLEEWVPGQNATPTEVVLGPGRERPHSNAFLCSFQIVYQEKLYIHLPHKTAAENILSNSFMCGPLPPPQGILPSTPNLYSGILQFFRLTFLLQENMKTHQVKFIHNPMQQRGV